MRRLLLSGLIALVLIAEAQAQTLAARVTTAIKTAGVPIISLTIGETANKATWKVQPPELQAAAQPTIDTFNVNDPAHELAELDAQVKVALDQERLFSALVWAIIDTYSGPATRAKYLAARQKTIDAYRTRPWAP